jgi:hypothetical protein
VLSLLSVPMASWCEKTVSSGSSARQPCPAGRSASGRRLAFGGNLILLVGGGAIALSLLWRPQSDVPSDAEISETGLIIGQCGRGSRCPGELLTSIAILELAELLEELNMRVLAQTCATGHFFRSTFAEHFS